MLNSELAILNCLESDFRPFHHFFWLKAAESPARYPHPPTGAMKLSVLDWCHENTGAHWFSVPAWGDSSEADFRLNNLAGLKK